MSELKLKDLDKEKVKKVLQIYEWYPVIGGCPECKAKITGEPSVYQRFGIQNLQVTNCWNCNVGLELKICYDKSGQLIPVDLSKYKHDERPKAHKMKAFVSDAQVLNPLLLMGKGGDS